MAINDLALFEIALTLVIVIIIIVMPNITVVFPTLTTQSIILNLIEFCVVMCGNSIIDI